MAPRFLSALTLALALALPVAAPANEKLAREFEGRLLAWSDLKPGTRAVALSVQGAPDQQVKAQSSSDGSQRRPAIVDGVWMDLPEWVIVGQIKAGVFKVVYPGTNIPFSESGPMVPNYPPPYIPRPLP